MLTCTVTLQRYTHCNLLIFFLSLEPFFQGASEVITIQKALISELPHSPTKKIWILNEAYKPEPKEWNAEGWISLGRQTIEREDFDELFQFHRASGNTSTTKNQGHNFAGTYIEKQYFLAWTFGSKSCFSDYVLIFKLYFFFKS